MLLIFVSRNYQLIIVLNWAFKQYSISRGLITFRTPWCKICSHRPSARSIILGEMSEWEFDLTKQREWARGRGPGDVNILYDSSGHHLIRVWFIDYFLDIMILRRSIDPVRQYMVMPRNYHALHRVLKYKPKIKQQSQSCYLSPSIFQIYFEFIIMYQIYYPNIFVFLYENWKSILF